MPLPRTKRCRPTSVDESPKRQKTDVYVQNTPGAASSKASKAVISDTVFATGAFRSVYKGVYRNGPRSGEEVVMKEFKSGCVFEATYFDADIKAVKKAGSLISSFNKLGLVSKTIYLNEPEVWTGEAGRIKKQKVLVEPMIKGDYFKFNSNTGHASPDTDAMQALSHFSYHHSKGKYVLCDLQGGRCDDCYVLTDPVILSSGKEFGTTDLGQQGIDNFMAHHKCGRFCNPKWKLPKPEKLVPTLRADPGTTFGYGISQFNDEHFKALQKKVRQCWDTTQCWDKHVASLPLVDGKKSKKRL